MSEVQNPYGNALATTSPQRGLATADVEGQRALGEVQAMVMMAKKFPRDPIQATDKILIECQRPGLAEVALYSYSRGGTDITGPSIRLAEVIARNWENMEVGVRELSHANGQSEMMSFCWDLESNVKHSKIFTVKHERTTKKGTYALTDSRDIYEATANLAARRLRAVILATVPGDVVEAAVNQCEETLRSKADTSPEATKKMVDAFSQFKVTKDQIEKRIQRRIDSITPAQVISLRKVFNSLKDGMSNASDWFETEVVDEPMTKGATALKEKLRKKPADPTPEKLFVVPPEGCVYSSVGEAKLVDCVKQPCFQECPEWVPEPGSGG